MEICVRKCVPEDQSALQKLSASTYYETFAPFNTAENMKKYLDGAFGGDSLKRELSCAQSEFFFALCDGVPAGYLKLNEAPGQTDINDPRSLEIQRIYVSAEYQRLGLGALLMKKALSAAAEAGKDYVWLGVWEKNEKALAFYKKYGFVQTGTHIFDLGGDKQTDLLLCRRLDGGER